MYSIQLLKDGIRKTSPTFEALHASIAKDGRFQSVLLMGHTKTTREDRKTLGNVLYLSTITPSKVRLTTPKPYCGQHPGECPVDGRKKPVSTWLEWDDWVQFHRLVNTVLNKLYVRANVWALPHDMKGRMWIRRDRFCRIKYDYDEKRGGMFPLRIWNNGTPDQFSTHYYSWRP